MFSLSLSLSFSPSLPLSPSLSHSLSLSLSPSRALGLEPRSRPQPTQKCWDCKACGHFSCQVSTRWGDVPGCCWQVECSTSPQRTHELLVRRDVSVQRRRGREGTVDVLALEEEGRERERVVGEDGRPPRFGRLGVISSTFTGSALPRFRGMMNLLGSWPCPCPRPPLLVRGF